MMKVALFTLGAGLVANSAFAETHVDRPVFDCTVANGKMLSITANPPFVYYSFGPAFAPELVIETPILDLEVTPWNGVGMAIYETARFAVDDYSYTVYHSFERVDHVRTAGVLVERNGDVLADIPCRDDFNIDSLWSFYDLKASAGQCWDDRALVWSTACDAD